MEISVWALILLIECLIIKICHSKFSAPLPLKGKYLILTIINKQNLKLSAVAHPLTTPHHTITSPLTTSTHHPPHHITTSTHHPPCHPQALEMARKTAKRRTTARRTRIRIPRRRKPRTASPRVPRTRRPKMIRKKGPSPRKISKPPRRPTRHTRAISKCKSPRTPACSTRGHRRSRL